MAQTNANTQEKVSDKKEKKVSEQVKKSSYLNTTSGTILLSVGGVDYKVKGKGTIEILDSLENEIPKNLPLIKLPK